MDELEKWYVVFTKPRQEKLAAEHLQRQGFFCFLPYANNPNRIRSRRIKNIVEPLFPRYLFIKVSANKQSLAPVKSTQGVANLVMFGSKMATVSTIIIKQIQNQVNTETGLIEIMPVKYEPGDKVRVLDGPLTGLEGIFKQTSSESRVILLMNMFGSQAKVQVQKDQLELVV